ncbi:MULTISPECIES: hypothetical protein [Streptomyces]|uniref:hypothetical protein n=1 Tax=Streptomyces TaxID=1883 RepID=UPI000ABFAACE|nr:MULTISPECIES: hypothetical protein [Streptomyces]MCI4084758.1 hypothetical protein [Streptomyces sp. MMS21 TC-5]GLV92193.1 hypothetical protein Slala04_36470 [Streptomyces lavendulae subsp. lavendulae]
MNPETKSSGRSLLGVGGLAALACCIGPIMAFLGGLGVLSAIGTFWVPALAALTAVALIAAAWVLHRRRRAAACKAAPGPVDLGLPTPPPAEPSTRSSQ